MRMPKILLYLILFVSFGHSLGSVDSVLSIADPANLTLGWWKNFEASKDQSNIDQLIEELQELKSQLDSRQHPLVIIEIDQVIVSAEKLQKLRSEGINYTPIQPLYLSKYTLSDFLKVVSQIRSLEKKQRELQENRELVQKNIDRLRNEIDALQLEYPLKEEGTAEKLMTGLKIMSLRFKIEVHQLEIKQMQKICNLIEDNLSKLEKEQEIAYARIDISNLKKENILGRINASQTLLVEANRQLLELNKQLDGEALFQPKTILVNLHLLRVKAEIVFEKIVLLFYQLQHGELEKEEIEQALIPLKNQLTSMKTFSQEIQQQLALIPPIEKAEYHEILSSSAALQGKIEDSQLLISRLEEKVVEKETTVDQYFFIVMNKIKGIGLSISKLMTVTIFRIDDYPVTLWVLFRALLILVGALLLSKISTKFFKKFHRLRSRLGRANTYILSRIVYYSMIIFGILAAAISLGIGLTNFVIIAGALGIGVGLGLQGIVTNFFSGLVVLFTKILKVGDVVETGNGSRGIVKAIRIQNTHIRTFDGEDVIFPNADLVTKKVINWTMIDPFIRLHIPFSVAYGSDREAVERVVLEVAKRIEYTVNNKKLCPEPRVRFLDFGNSSLNLELTVWINVKEDPRKGYIKTQYLWEIEKELKKADIDIPFPISNIRLM